MPSPRQIAEQVDTLDPTAESGYDSIAGTPVGVSKQGTFPNYAVNPVNPPDHEPLPATNLKG
jgi:hypothetical protein